MKRITGISARSLTGLRLQGKERKPPGLFRQTQHPRLCGRGHVDWLNPFVAGVAVRSDSSRCSPSGTNRNVPCRRFNPLPPDKRAKRGQAFMPDDAGAGFRGKPAAVGFNCEGIIIRETAVCQKPLWSTVVRPPQSAGRSIGDPEEGAGCLFLGPCHTLLTLP